MAEDTKERSDNEWQGSPLQMGSGLDPYGIQEIVIEFDTSDEEVLKPQGRAEFGSYELHETSTYLDIIKGQLRLSEH